MSFPALDIGLMTQLATSYFDTFNLFDPFMDRQHFMENTLVKVHTGGFREDNDSVIALLIFVLGEMSREGSSGNPINTVEGRPSGVRGGSSNTPPGMTLFTEARRRLDFVLIDCELENVQINCLVG